MLKNYALVLCFFLITFNLKSQTFYGPENIIFLTDLTVPASVYVSDLDGDGDFDVLVGYEKDLIWFENTDGKGSFSSQQIIVVLDNDITFVTTADLDGDGDQDILVAIEAENKIAWYENIDGKGSFGPQQVITTSADRAWSVHAADLDGDGDLDILSASVFDNKIAWYENTDGKGTFGPQQVISTNAHWATAVITADLDNDGDLDVISVSGSWADNKIVWYENIDGLGNFGTEKIITTSVNGALSVTAADVNGNGNVDILSASVFDNKIAWYENTDGNGTFGPQQIITTKTQGATYVSAGDVDNNGYMDVLSASQHDNKVAMYKNLDGQGNFSTENILSTTADEAGYVVAVDLDGDGDLDVLAASCDFKIAWHKNTLPLKIINNPEDIAVLPKESAGFQLEAVDAVFFQWQLDNGNGFVDLNNDTIYDGVDNDTLTISEAEYSMTGHKYRCLVANAKDTLYSKEVLLTVIDTIKPQITSVHNDQILDANEGCKGILPDYTKTVTATDNGQEPLNISQTPFPYSEISNTHVEVVLTVTDRAGNSSEESFTVTVQDNTPPVIKSSYTDQEFIADYNCEAIVPYYSVEATDNCDWFSLLTIEQSPEFGSTVTGESNEITLTVTDNAGNSSQLVFNLSVIDNSRPTIGCPEDTTLHINVGETAYVVSGTAFDPVHYQDNCEIVSLTNDFNNLSTLDQAELPQGKTTVTWTATDNAGNEASCQLEIQVDETSGIEDLIDKGILLYPNPADNTLHFESEKCIDRIEISELSGKIRIIETNLDQKGIINLSSLNPGIYILSITTSDNLFNTKIIKE